ncbi:helix-turn-helix domain-containing protein [Cupriavidus oxalaticus]|uniref:Helix-turn-helix domain-containing protein n=1 Tax=Cupriavidus oxalaticus TaxID=96344 RepID=A0A4V1BYP4_9BURK|nr:helix-turn-helix domain-containing protein [Cupriavidus oxalaticus]QBY52532.1 helix-turn-helix domain-containing protein [Cupriavidus oxalaticus]
MAHKPRPQPAPEQFYGLFDATPRLLERHPICQRLSHPAYRLLHLAVDLHDGHSNGHLCLSFTTLNTRYGWNSRDTLGRALAELVDAGLLVRTRQGGRSNGPSLFALPWLDIDSFKGLDLTPEQYASGARTGFRCAKEIRQSAARSGLSARDIADRGISEWLAALSAGPGGGLDHGGTAGPGDGFRGRKTAIAGPGDGAGLARKTGQRKPGRRVQNLTTGPGDGLKRGQKLEVLARLPGTVAYVASGEGISRDDGEEGMNLRSRDDDTPDPAGMLG